MTLHLSFVLLGKLLWKYADKARAATGDLPARNPSADLQESGLPKLQCLLESYSDVRHQVRHCSLPITQQQETMTKFMATLVNVFFH